MDLPAPAGSRFKQSIDGQSTGTQTDLTGKMLAPILSSAGPGDGVYRIYSAITHGELYGLMQFFTEVAQPDGSVMLRWGMRDDDLKALIGIAIAAFREPSFRINEVIGRGKIETQIWYDKVAPILN